MNRHKCETAARPGSGRREFRDNGHTAIAQPPGAVNGDPPAHQQLAAYIVRHHMASLGSAWGLALCQSLSWLRCPLNQQQAACLAAIWQRLQAVRA